MIKIARKGSLFIPKSEEPLCELIKKNLTRKFKIFQKSAFETWKFYVETDEYLLVPRYYPVWDLINCEIVDMLHDGFDININHNIKPKNDLQEKALDYMLSHNSGIINLDTGEGKTVITIAAISELKKKTIILLHKSNLVEQWIKEIEKFTNIRLGKDMSVLNNTRIQKSLEKSIVISTVQTLVSALKRKKNELILELDKAKFGLMVSDEIHTTIGAKKFSECSLFIPIKSVFGLSATPYRNDGTSDILTYHLGNIYKPTGQSRILDAKVTIILFNSGILPKSKRYIYWGGCFQRSRYLNLLKKSKVFDICLSLLNRLKDDRNIFVIIERIKFIELLYKSFDYDDKNTFFKKDSNNNLKNRVILAIPKKLRDGIDVPNKDALIMTSPISNIQQMCGRVLRPDKNKKEPIIIDLVDVGCYDISKTLFNRLKFYKLKNWKIQFLHVDDEKIIPISENDLKKLIKRK